MVTAGSTNSAAVGVNNRIAGASSGAFGTGQTVDGSTTFGIGVNNFTFGTGTYTIGNSNTTVGDGVHVLGTHNFADPYRSAGNSTNVNVVGATNSVAVGQGSVASAPNTVSFGTTGNERRLTNVAAGISQTDAVNVGQMSSVTAGLQSQISNLQTQVASANSGIAMAMAMGGGFLPEHKRVAVAANYGTFAGKNALALTGLARVSDHVVMEGAAAYGINNNSNQFGGRVGMLLAW